ncbi:hypothetical protein Tco_1439117 [Tanacetum coccineum]
MSYASTTTADVPAVYLQQFWKTVHKVPNTKDTIRFKLDTQEIVYTVDMFHDILKLPVETPDNPFVAPALRDIIWLMCKLLDRKRYAYLMLRDLWIRREDLEEDPTEEEPLEEPKEEG